MYELRNMVQQRNEHVREDRRSLRRGQLRSPRRKLTVAAIAH